VHKVSKKSKRKKKSIFLIPNRAVRNQRQSFHHIHTRPVQIEIGTVYTFLAIALFPSTNRTIPTLHIASIVHDHSTSCLSIFFYIYSFFFFLSHQNVASYLCQLDRLEKFTIFQNPGLDIVDIKELKVQLPTLLQIGIGHSETLSDEDVLAFNQLNHRPCIRVYRRMLESSYELDNYTDQP